MSIERNEALARLWFEKMWSKPAPELADEIISPDYAPDWVQIPVTGPAQIKHEIRYFRSIFPDLRYEIVEMAAQEDRVWVRYRGSGTQQGSAWGFPAGNRTASYEGATILYVNKDGLISDRWGAFSFYDLFAELGLVPPIYELSQYFSWPTGGEK